MSKIIFMTLLFLGCTTGKVPHGIYTKANIEENPNRYNNEDLVVALFNQADLTNSTSKDPPQSFGKNITKKYIEILKQKYSPNLMIINLGGVTSAEFIKNQKFEAIAAAPSDINQLMDKRRKKIRLPYVSSNLLKIDHPPRIKNLYPYKIINANNKKIAMISLSQFANHFSKKYKNLNRVYIDDPVLSFIKIKSLLRKKKIDLYITIINNFSKDKDLSSILNRLPSLNNHLIVTVDNNYKKSDLSNIHITSQKNFLHLVQLNKKTNSVIRYDQIKICSYFWSVTKDCDLGEEKFRESKLKLILENNEVEPAQFLGHKIILSKDK